MTESPGGATVRSVRVRMELDIASYMAKANTVGRGTEAMADRIDRSFTRTNRSLGDSTDALGGTEEAIKKTDRRTRDYTLAMAMADEKSRRLRQSLRDQARAAIDAEQGLNRTERALSRTNSQLDTFSGRTGLILKALALVGPALVPLSAGLVPVLSLIATGGVAAAAGLGVTVLAVQGLGDAMKALDTWQLEKTPENLAAVRQEFARIGVDGVQFVRFLDSLEPKLRNLQLIARAGALPGFEDGIRELMDLLPEAKFLVQDLSETLGDLASDAGESLSGEDFESFFDYLKTDAAPTLDALSRVAGNFTLAFANLLVGLAPATRDATGGLLEFSEGIADASANLDSNEGFQKFLAYVREEGPKAAEFIGSVAGAVSSLAQAAAPYGSVVLPVLTATADLFSAIASSPAGPVLISAAAGLTLYGRAAAFAGPQIAKLKAGGIGTAVAGVNPAALGAAALVVAITEVVAADDELVAATKRAQDAINSGDTSQMRTELKALQDELEATSIKMYEDTGATSGLPFIGNMSAGLEQAGNLWAKYSGAQEKAKDTEKELQDAIAGGGGVLTGYRNSILRTADAALQEAAALQAATDAMREKRQEALRGLNAELDYQQAIDDARKSLRENGATLDETTNKGRENLRNLYALAGAWNEQSDAAKNARGALAQAKSNFIETATAMDMPIGQARRLANQLFEIPTYRSTKVQVETETAMSRLAALKNRYDAIRDKSVTISINSGGGTGGGAPMGVPLSGQADGGTIRGPRQPYRDKVLAYLAPGEEVISNRHGQADRARPLLKRINAGRFADGGTISTYTSRRGGWAEPSMPDGWIKNLGGAADRVVGSLKKLEARLDKMSTAYEKEKSKLESLTSARQSAAEAVASSLVRDPFGNGLAGFDAQVDADTADIKAMGAALATLVRNGLDPKSALYQQLAASSDVNTAKQLAALSSGELADRARRFEVRASEASALSGTVAGQAYDESIRKQTKATERLDRTMDELKDAIRDLKHVPKKLHDAVLTGAHQGTAAGAEEGTRKGQDEKRRNLAAQVRTEGRPLAVRGRG